MYLTLSMSLLFGYAELPIVKILLESINNTTSVLLVMAFAVLDQPSPEDHNGVNRDFRLKKTLTLVVLAAVVASLAYAFALKAKMWFELEISPGWTLAMRIPGALLASVAFGLLIGRLDSKYLAISRIKIGILYGYSALQMLWPLLDASVFPHQIVAMVFLASLVGKITLWKAIDGTLAHDERRLRDYIEHTHIWDERQLSRKKALRLHREDSVALAYRVNSPSLGHSNDSQSANKNTPKS